MVIRRWFIYLWIFTLVFSFLPVCAGVGDDDSGGGSADDDTAADDTDIPDDDVADDTVADDDTAVGDDTVVVTLVLDDGSAEGGWRTLSYPSGFVQAFTPPAYPAQLESVSIYIDRADGLDRNTVLVIFYNTSMESPHEPIYTSDPFRFTTGEAWNVIDFSWDYQLATVIESGDFYIGILATDDLDTGPYIGLDYEGSTGSIWIWDGTNWLVSLSPGVLMIRPTIQCPAF